MAGEAKITAQWPVLTSRSWDNLRKWMLFDRKTETNNNTVLLLRSRCAGFLKLSASPPFLSTCDVTDKKFPSGVG